MTRQRQEYLNELTDWLIRLELAMACDIALRHQDSHIELETFFRDLLNLVFDWNLDNANTLFGRNQDSFDLCDIDGAIAVQVTVTTSAKKIRKTIKSFVGKHDSAYRRLLFVYPKIELPANRADFRNALKGFDFDADRDRIGFGTILRKAQGFTIDRLEQLTKLVRKELRPLGRQLPVVMDKIDHSSLVDQNIELTRRINQLLLQHSSEMISKLIDEIRDARSRYDSATAIEKTTLLEDAFKVDGKNWSIAMQNDALITIAETLQNKILSMEEDSSNVLTKLKEILGKISNA